MTTVQVITDDIANTPSIPNTGVAYYGRLTDEGNFLVTIHKDRRRVATLPHHKHHSTAGYSWGYLGSGPADLALALMVNYYKRRGDKVTRKVRVFEGEVDYRAFQFHQALKFGVVSKIPHDTAWVLTYDELDTWVRAQEQAKATEHIEEVHA